MNTITISLEFFSCVCVFNGCPHKYLYYIDVKYILVKCPQMLSGAFGNIMQSFVLTT